MDSVDQNEHVILGSVNDKLISPVSNKNKSVIDIQSRNMSGNKHNYSTA